MKTSEILLEAKKVKGALGALSADDKNCALMAMADALIGNDDEILAANHEDVENAREHISSVMLDRLILNRERIAAMAEGIRSVAALEDPIGRILSQTTRPNGLIIEKISVPLGVVAIIYESRPNVTSDAAALCLKSGNVCVLRSGKEAFASAHAIVAAMRRGLSVCGLPRELINIIDDTSRDGARELMHARGFVDLLFRAAARDLSAPVWKTRPFPALKPVPAFVIFTSIKARISIWRFPL